MPAERSTFFFDLRCPFCFVARERIGALGLGASIAYRSVRHDREAAVPAMAPSTEERALLTRELAVLAERAPEVSLALPAVWPSARPAARVLAALARVGGDADAFVAALSRALWREGHDPSSPLVLGEALRAASAGSLVPTAEDEATLERWRLDWAGREQRTPMIVSPHGVALVGLPSERRLAAFLRSGRLGDETDDVCGVTPRSGETANR